MDVQEYDLDLLGIAAKVFSGPIKDPFMYQIEFDPSERTPDTPIPLYIFEQLMILFTEGIKIYFNQENIAIETISQQDFYKIQQYFKSLGFILNCQISPILNEEKINSILSTLHPDELPPLSASTSTSDSTKTTICSSSNNSKISFTGIGNELKDYTYTLTKDNLRYIISFDILKHSSHCKT